MALKQGSERGFAQLGASLLLSLVAALFLLGGCSAGAPNDAVESLGRTEQAACLCPRPSGCVASYDCNLLTGACTPVPAADLTACGTSGVCASGVCCTSGCLIVTKGPSYTCDPGTTAAHCGAKLDKCVTCNDGDPCTTDVCTTSGTCGTTPAPDRTACPDGTKCNGDEFCSGGKCVGPTSFSCDDKNPCTAESCDPVTGCASSPLSGTSCADANLCNGDETCSSGVCKAGKVPNCDDSNPCTADTCDALKGCLNTPLTGASCSDGNKCNGEEVCNGSGVCKGGTAPTCDDNNPCTADSCDPAGGCSNAPVGDGTKCDDGNVCNGIAVCSSGACKAPAVGLNCDDGEVCTDDACDPVAGCKHTNNTKACSDNNLCTTNDTCSGGSCVGGPAPNCDDNQSCTRDTCLPSAGCQHAPVADNTGCDDGNSCTAGDKCTGGTCSGVGKACDDNNPCTKNSCDASNQVCANPAEMDGVPCTYDACHQNSACSGGKCAAGTPISCDDDNPCTVDSCDAAAGCKHVPDDTATCSDGNACTQGDKCKSGACVGKAVACSPLDSCHKAGTCAPDTGICNDPRAPDNTQCPGGSCQVGKCVALPEGGAAGASDGGAAGDTSSSSAGAPSGGTGTGTGGAGPVGDAGAVTAEAGDTSTGGALVSAGGRSSSAGKGGTLLGEAGTDIPEDQIFKRHPGGCSCSLPGPSKTPGAWFAVAALLAALRLRRRRAA